MARASWTPKRGYWEWLRDLDRICSGGGAYVGGRLWLGPRAGDGWAEASWNGFDWVCDKIQMPPLSFCLGVTSPR